MGTTQNNRFKAGDAVRFPNDPEIGFIACAFPDGSCEVYWPNANSPSGLRSFYDIDFADTPLLPVDRDPRWAARDTGGGMGEITHDGRVLGTADIETCRTLAERCAVAGTPSIPERLALAEEPIKGCSMRERGKGGVG